MFDIKPTFDPLLESPEDWERIEEKSKAESVLPKDSELLDFYYLSDRKSNEEQWIEDAKEQFELEDDETIDSVIQSMAHRNNSLNGMSYKKWLSNLKKMSPEEQRKEKLDLYLQDYVYNKEEDEDSSQVFFENPRIVGKTTLYRFIDRKEAVQEILKDGFSGHSANNLGLTRHGGGGRGPLAFAFEKKDLKSPKDFESARLQYGEYLFKFNVPYAVKVFHNTDYEDQIVFDVSTVTNLKYLGNKNESLGD